MRRTLAAVLVAVLTPAAFAETTDEWVRFGRTRAALLETQGRFEEAVEEWISVGSLTPKDPRPLVRAAVLAVEAPLYRGVELEPGTAIFGMAQQCVRQAVMRWGQGDPALSYVIGRLHYAEKKWSPAVKTLGDAMRGGFDPLRTRLWLYRATVNRSVMLIENNRAQDALEDLKAMRQAMPGHPDEHFLIVDLAAAHRGVQEHDTAMKLVDEEIARNPGAADARYLRGKILTDEGRLEEAEDSFRKVMMNLQYGDKLYCDALLRMGEVDIKLNRLDAAETAARQYLAIRKDDPEGLFLLGKVEHARGRLEEAVVLFRRVRRASPGTMDTLVSLHQVLYQLGETQEAEQVKRQIEEIHRRVNAELMGQPDASAPPAKTDEKR
jgi:tetratricopeptide (TPR) repeat protein